jgi:hypothetical protein
VERVSRHEASHSAAQHELRRLGPPNLCYTTGRAPPENVAKIREAGFDAELPKSPKVELRDGILSEMRREGPT